MRYTRLVLWILFIFLISNLALASYNSPFSPTPKKFMVDSFHSVVVITDTEILNTIDIFFGNFSDYNDDILKLQIKGDNPILFLDNTPINYTNGLAINVSRLNNSRLHIKTTLPLRFESYLNYKTLFVEDVKFFSSNSRATAVIGKFGTKFKLDGDFEFVENSYTSLYDDFLYYQKDNFNYDSIQITIKRQGIETQETLTIPEPPKTWSKFIKIMLSIFILSIIILLLIKRAFFSFNNSKDSLEEDDLYSYIKKYEQMGYSRQKLIDWLSSQGHSTDSIKRIIETHEMNKSINNSNENTDSKPNTNSNNNTASNDSDNKGGSKVEEK